MQAVLLGEIERSTVAVTQKCFRIERVLAKVGAYRVDDLARMTYVVRVGDDGLAGGAWTEHVARILELLRSRSPENCTAYAAAVFKLAVRGVHNCVESERGDVGSDDGYGACRFYAASQLTNCYNMQLVLSAVENKCYLALMW